MVFACKICGVRKHEVQGIMLHAFPKDPTRLQHWLRVFNKSEDDDFTKQRVCSRHFSEHQYETSVGPYGNCFKRLKHDAVPDVFYTIHEGENHRSCRSIATQTDITVPPFTHEDTVLPGCVVENRSCKRKYHSSRTGEESFDEPHRQDLINASNNQHYQLLNYESTNEPMVNSSSSVEIIESQLDTLIFSPTKPDDEIIDSEEIQTDGGEAIIESDVSEETDQYLKILQSLEESFSVNNEKIGYSVIDEDNVAGSSSKAKSKNIHPFSHLGPAVNIEFITEDELHYLVGFSRTQFEYILCLTEKKNELNWPCYMPLKNQLQLTLIKLRLNFDYTFLSILFRVSQKMVSRVFKFWVELLDDTVNSIDFWNLGIKGENLYRAVVDCSEFVIEKPSEVLKQQVTWSSYKHRNTMKVMIAIDENGTVVFVSPLFGGSASDDVIVEKSGLLNLLKRGEHVLADRGFELNDKMAEKGIILNKPPSKKGDQLSETEVANTRAIASRRVEVERVIGLAKDNRIITQRINHCLFPLADKIVNVVFKLTNFKDPICKGVTE